MHHTQYTDQYTKYTNRYGPGAVVYWFDYIDDLQQHDDLVLLHGLPGSDAITVLPQLPMSLVNIPQVDPVSGGGGRVGEEEGGVGEEEGGHGGGVQGAVAPAKAAAIAV